MMKLNAVKTLWSLYSLLYQLRSSKHETARPHDLSEQSSWPPTCWPAQVSGKWSPRESLLRVEKEQLKPASEHKLQRLNSPGFSV